MKFLLDTHALLFWVYEPARLGALALRAMADRDNQIFWSTASSWEVAIKVGLGKLELDGPVSEVIPSELLRHGFTLLPIDHAHVLAVAELPRHHGDPFDRLLVAQAQAERLTLLTADPRIAAYDIAIVW
ncbi:MAG: type II toxin-antitoxin system VapC family toxin [Pseudomonadota bacterium]|nr:type II toxin-antitoxin system VapC family toxin [Pseudomonadota bacterium]